MIRYLTYIENFLGNYKNFGQDAEQTVRFELTGEIRKADNIPFTVSADCLMYQIKAERATICKGSTLEDIKKHLELDKAEKYIYVSKNHKCYELDKTDFFTFVSLFFEVTTDSTKNGGSQKIRLNRRFTDINKWLEENC